MSLLDVAGSNGLRDAIVLVHHWIKKAFGSVLRQPLDPRERGLRFVEEAIELAQACGVAKQEVAALTQRVYEKPPDAIHKELGQSFITLLELAAGTGRDLPHAVNTEWDRIEKLGTAHFAERMRRKIELGFSNEPVAKDGIRSKPLAGYTTCPSCKGVGEVGVGTRDCGDCKGTGFVEIFPTLSPENLKHFEARPKAFTFGPGVLYGGASDETIWEQSRAAAQSLTDNIGELQRRGYEVTVHIVTALPTAAHRYLYGKEPHPEGYLSMVTDPRAIVVKSAEKTTKQGFTND